MADQTNLPPLSDRVQEASHALDHAVWPLAHCTVAKVQAARDALIAAAIEQGEAKREAESAALTCEHCDLPLVCPSAAAERICGLEQMNADNIRERDQAHAELAKLREALVKVRMHTAYYPHSGAELLAGLLSSIERIADDALKGTP